MVLLTTYSLKGDGIFVPENEKTVRSERVHQLVLYLTSISLWPESRPLFFNPSGDFFTLLEAGMHDWCATDRPGLHIVSDSPVFSCSPYEIGLPRRANGRL